MDDQSFKPFSLITTTFSRNKLERLSQQEIPAYTNKCEHGSIA